MMGSASFMGRLLAASLTAGAALCAIARVEWIEKDYDFGLMKEVAGPKTGVSRFVNLGPDTVSIFNVRPSCGCTSADWSDDPVAPGDTATVAYTYDPAMRPGRFEKSVKVQLSDGTRHSIRITGNVYGTPQSVAQLYPFEAGDLRLSEVAVNMGDVTRGRVPVKFVNAYLLSPDSVTPQVSSDIAGLKISPSVEHAGPGDLITYSLSYDPTKGDAYGPVEGMITFATPGNSGTLPWRAFVLPDAERLAITAGRQQPVCEPESALLDFGSVSRHDATLTAELIIRNPGKGDLEIFRIVPSHPALEVAPGLLRIKKGKTARVKVTLDPARLAPGAARHAITLLTSDPLRTRLDIPVALFAAE